MIERMPCTIRLLPTPKTIGGVLRLRRVRTAGRAAAGAIGRAYLVVLLGGEAGLRCGEMMALEWTDVDLAQAAALRGSGRTGRAR